MGMPDGPDRDERTILAEDRTLLASERTFAGWVRTGLAAGTIALIGAIWLAPIG
jgi:putative membrane protein